ncbi:hypothetical protein JBL43_19745 [Aureibaculum sp. A20]|uniref:Lipoprotein n=1 Tax=Aureibaculum flavum TaxID=2795986 RepID=A0ABS0WX80_9FLAO|nr:hypothetical protein [Aureibaculum flavum]MBJ2176493.1 hypothetical protein [Aureibaculum flavum]
MKKLFLLLFAIGGLISCNNDDDNIEINEQNFLIFGHFYGECFGEGCVETFKLTDKKLYEDTLDDYSGQNLEFIALENDKFEDVKNLGDFFPNQLLNESETVFGCPDCADGGGLFIQYSENGNVKSWRIDQDKNNVPTYLHNFIDKVNEKIKMINN